MDLTATSDTSLPKLAAFWSRHAFAIGNVDYESLDVALAAMVRDHWSAFERRLAEGLACAALAELEGSGPSAADLEAAATAFRYDRELISAAEMNAWLDQVDVSADDWTGYLNRDLLRRARHDHLEDILDRHQPSSRQLMAAAFVEGVCSGLFDSFDDAFSGRAALADEFLQRTNGDRAPTRDAEAMRLARTHAHWLSMRPVEDTLARLDRILKVEASFDAAVADLLSHTSLAEIVDLHRIEWRQIEMDTLSLPTEQAAREAALCVSADHLSLHDVAALARHPAERRSHFEDEIDPDLRDRLAAVEPGRVFGPTAVEGHFEIRTVVSRAWPALSDPRVAERARQSAVDEATRRAVRERVTRRRVEV